MLNPYSQYVSKEENGVVWHIKTITDEADFHEENEELQLFLRKKQYK